MSFRSHLAVCLLATALLISPTAHADTTTQPSQTFNGPNGGYRQSPGMLLQRFRNALAQIDLTADQQSQVNTLIDKVTQEAKDMQPDLASMKPSERLQKVLALAQELREGVAGILTPDQQQQLREKLRPQGGQGGQNGQGGAGPLVTLYRLHQALQQMQLTDDQKKQIDLITQDIRQRAPALRQAMQNGEDISSQLQEMNQEIRQELGAILTSDQRQQLRQIMPSIGYLPGAAGTTPQPTPTVPAMPPPPVVDPNTSAQIAAHNAAVAAAPASPQGHAPATADIGQTAPDFSLRTLQNSTVDLASMKGRTVVLEFGSYTCPSFRDRAPDMEKLRRQYSGTVSFFVVYTREAHPQGDWQVQRNRDAGIILTQPADMNARRQAARTAVTSLHLTIPVLIDTMDDAVTTAYGGMPNATVVIGRDGRIVARQHWTDPSGLPTLIDAALAVPATQPGA